MLRTMLILYYLIFGVYFELCLAGVDMAEFSKKRIMYTHCQNDSSCGTGPGIFCDRHSCGCRMGYYHVKKPIPDSELRCAKQLEFGRRCVFNKECLPPLRCKSGTCTCPDRYQFSRNISAGCVGPSKSFIVKDHQNRSNSVVQGTSVLILALLAFWASLLSAVLVCCFCKRQRLRKFCWRSGSSFGMSSPADALLSPNEHIISEYGKPDDGVVEAAATQNLYTRLSVMLPPSPIFSRADTPPEQTRDDLPSYEDVTLFPPSYEEATQEVI